MLNLTGGNFPARLNHIEYRIADVEGHWRRNECEFQSDWSAGNGYAYCLVLELVECPSGLSPLIRVGVRGVGEQWKLGRFLGVVNLKSLAAGVDNLEYSHVGDFSCVVASLSDLMQHGYVDREGSLAMSGYLQSTRGDSSEGVPSSLGASGSEEMESSKFSGWAGLKNHGATCYMNSLLQCLYHIPRFRLELFRVEDKETMSQCLKALEGCLGDKATKPLKVGSLPKVPFSNGVDTWGEKEFRWILGDGVESLLWEGSIPTWLALQNLMYRLSSASEPLSCKELISSFGWSTSDLLMQQDTHELYKLLLNKVEEQMKGTPAEGSVTKLFQGKIESYVECMDVDFTSKREETFEDIQLEVENCANMIDSLRHTLKPEMLDGDNMYDAEHHGCQRAMKGIRYLHLPPVLVFLLKRFTFNFSTMDTVKLNSKFEFYPKIDMGQFCAGSGEYTLHCVTVHQGHINGGHYYVFVNVGNYGKTNSDMTWIRCDDDKVYPASEASAIQENFGGSDRRSSHSAYMLVYLRTTVMDKLLQEGESPKRVGDRCLLLDWTKQLKNWLRGEVSRTLRVRLFLPSSLLGIECSDADWVEATDRAGGGVNGMSDEEIMKPDTVLVCNKCTTLYELVQEIRQKMQCKSHEMVYLYALGLTPNCPRFDTTPLMSDDVTGGDRKDIRSIRSIVGKLSLHKEKMPNLKSPEIAGLVRLDQMYKNVRFKDLLNQYSPSLTFLVVQLHNPSHEECVPSLPKACVNLGPEFVSSSFPFVEESGIYPHLPKCKYVDTVDEYDEFVRSACMIIFKYMDFENSFNQRVDFFNNRFAAPEHRSYMLGVVLTPQCIRLGCLLNWVVSKVGDLRVKTLASDSSSRSYTQSSAWLNPLLPENLELCLEYGSQSRQLDPTKTLLENQMYSGDVVMCYQKPSIEYAEECIRNRQVLFCEPGCPSEMKNTENIVSLGYMESLVDISNTLSVNLWIHSIDGQWNSIRMDASGTPIIGRTNSERASGVNPGSSPTKLPKKYTQITVSLDGRIRLSIISKDLLMRLSCHGENDSGDTPSYQIAYFPQPPLVSKSSHVIQSESMTISELIRIMSNYTNFMEGETTMDPSPVIHFGLISSNVNTLQYTYANILVSDMNYNIICGERVCISRGKLNNYGLSELCVDLKIKHNLEYDYVLVCMNPEIRIVSYDDSLKSSIIGVGDDKSINNFIFENKDSIFGDFPFIRSAFRLVPFLGRLSKANDHDRESKLLNTILVCHYNNENIGLPVFLTINSATTLREICQKYSKRTNLPISIIERWIYFQLDECNNKEYRNMDDVIFKSGLNILHAITISNTSARRRSNSGLKI